MSEVTFMLRLTLVCCTNCWHRPVLERLPLGLWTNITESSRQSAIIRTKLFRHPTPDKRTIMYILLYSTHFTFLYCILWDPSTFNVPSTSDSLRAWVLLVGDWEVLGILLFHTVAFDSFLGHKYIPLGTKKQGDASLAKWMDASFPGVCVLWQWQERHVGVTRCLTQISPFIELVFGGALQAKTVLLSIHLFITTWYSSVWRSGPSEAFEYPGKELNCWDAHCKARFSFGIPAMLLLDRLRQSVRRCRFAHAPGPILERHLRIFDQLAFLEANN